MGESQDNEGQGKQRYERQNLRILPALEAASERGIQLSLGKR